MTGSSIHLGSPAKSGRPHGGWSDADQTGPGGSDDGNGTDQSSGLSSDVLARGGWDRAERTAFLSALARQGSADASEVAVILASLAPGGYTYWHGHPGPSVVVVTDGAVTVLEPTAAGGCAPRTYETGDAFFHGAGNHDFRNLGTETAELYITYFVTSWPPLVHTDDPGACG